MAGTTNMSTPVTRSELREEIDRLDQRFAQMASKADLAQMASKADLALWAGALQEHLLTELARHTRAVLEAMSTQISTFDDKYADLPGRMTRLETAVFTRTPR